MQRLVVEEMAVLVFEDKAVDVAWAVVQNTLLAGCKLVQQVVAAYLKRLRNQRYSISLSGYTRRKSD